jgi:predicted nuclease with TOPRIM domain
MSDTKYPKVVELMRRSLQGQGDPELANELARLVLEYNTVSKEIDALKKEVSKLKEENACLSGELEAYKEAVEAAMEEAAIPHYPDDFYFYGTSPSTYRLSNDEINDLIHQAYDAELEDGQFIDVSEGDTLVIKVREGGVEKIYVARNYGEADVAEYEEESAVAGRNLF